MQMVIEVLAWHRHKNVADLNQFKRILEINCLNYKYSPDLKGRRTNTYFIPGEHYRLPVAFGLLFWICCLNTEFCVCFVEEWKDLTGKVSKANTAKCEAQAKLSDLQSSMVTSEVRNYT